MVEKKEVKKKKFKLPYRIKSQLKKLAMKNKVQVMLIQNNRNIKPTIGELKNGMLILDDETIHDCPVDCVGLWNGKFPTVILPEWDLKPLSLGEIYQDAMDNGRSSYAQKIILRALEYKESLAGGKKIPGKTFIWLFLPVLLLIFLTLHLLPL